MIFNLLRLLFIYIVFCSFSDQKTYNQFRMKHAKTIYEISLKPRDGKVGTGFQIKIKGYNYIITARHVCVALKSNVSDPAYYINTLTSSQQRSRILFLSKEEDLCLMTGSDLPDYLEFGKPAKDGDMLYLVGFPVNYRLHVESGFYIGDTVNTTENISFDIVDGKCNGFTMNILFDEFCIQNYDLKVVTARAQGGNSGGPVFDMSHKVVGVVVQADNAHNAIFIDVSRVKRFLEKVEDKL